MNIPKKNYKYYIAYKPYRVLSQFTSIDGKKCFADYFKFEKDVYSVGRLDYDSEGLMLLTNDNYLKTIVLDPVNCHLKEYFVQVDGVIDEEAVFNLQHGVEIKLDAGLYKTKPCKAEKLNGEPGLPDRDPPVRYREIIPSSWIRIAIFEGKNRQIRRMAAKVGFPALRIVRVAIGNIVLGDMKPGDYKELKQELVFSKLNIKNHKFRF